MAVAAVAQSLDRAPADVALAWLVERPGISGVIAGASHPRQLEQNLAPFVNPLPADAVAQLDRVTLELKDTLGSNIDSSMWQTLALSSISSLLQAYEITRDKCWTFTSRASMILGHVNAGATPEDACFQ